MPIAAVPNYLGQDFQDASPGLRFGMYLKLWGVNHRSKALLWQTHDIRYEIRGQHREEREVKYENKVSALDDSTRLTPRDQALMRALVQRQTQCALTVPPAQLLRLDARTVAPFTTGLGNEHPLENGFAFLNPYGLPYLPGSGVKGVLRQAARELASGAWGETHGWSDQATIPLLQGEGDRRRPVRNEQTQQPVYLTLLDVLFGRESMDGDTDHVRGALTFWDVLPQIGADRLMVEIMTPHQSHYYQQSRERKSGDSTSPHDSGQPNPISFLTVPPDSGFTFFVVCDVTHLARLAPELIESDAATGHPRWRLLMTAAFEHAFRWLGFGAKTAVGYGALEVDRARQQVVEAEQAAARAEAEREREAAEAERRAREEAARRQALTDAQRQIEDFVAYMQKRYEALRGRPVRANGEEHQRARVIAQAALESADWTAEERRAAAEAIATWLPKVVAVDMKDERKRLKLAQLRGEG